MFVVVEHDEKLSELVGLWDELVFGTEEFAVWGEGDFDQELFKEALYKTWKLFSERIDFEAPNSGYSLSIGMAYILGRMMEYSDKQQIASRADEGDIELSARIVNKLANSIVNRERFPRNEPIVKTKIKFDNGIIVSIEYNIETGVLKVSNGLKKDAPQKFDKTLETTDISRWWDMNN